MITKCTQITTNTTYTMDMILDKMNRVVKDWFENPDARFQAYVQDNDSSENPIFGILGLTEKDEEKFSKWFICTGARAVDYWTDEPDVPIMLPQVVADMMIAVGIGENSWNLQGLDENQAVFQTVKCWAELEDEETFEKTYLVLISRSSASTLQDILESKGIKDYQIIKTNGKDGRLKPYEEIAGRPLTRADAVIVSRISPDEIEQMLEESGENNDLQAKELERRLSECMESDDFIAEITKDAYIPTGEYVSTSDMIDTVLHNAEYAETEEVEIEEIGTIEVSEGDEGMRDYIENYGAMWFLPLKVLAEYGYYPKIHTVVIDRKYADTVRDIFAYEKLCEEEEKILVMDSEADDTLKPYEDAAGRPLTTSDAVVISRFSESYLMDKIWNEEHYGKAKKYLENHRK